MQAPPQGERAMEKRVGAGTWAVAEAGGRELRRMKMSFVERRAARTLFITSILTFLTTSLTAIEWWLVAYRR